MKATIVFQKNWEAINERLPDGKRKYRYIINTGSSRSSKTYSILQSHYLQAWSNQNKRISIWRDTKKDTKDTVLADFKKALPSFENSQSVNFNKTESIYTFPNGSTIEISGSDDDTKVHGFQGDILHLNEPYKIRKEVFDQLDMRTSDYVLIDWNPKTNHWIDTLAKQENAIVINSTYKDNPFCPEEQRIKIESYQPISYSRIYKYFLKELEEEVKKGYVLQSGLRKEDLVKAKTKEYPLSENPLKFEESDIEELRRCIKNEAQGTADEYMWSVYGLGEKSEKPNKIFKGWKSMDVNDFLALPYPSYYGMDFGLTNPSALSEVKYNDGTFYVHELLYKPEKEMNNGLVHELNRIGIDKSLPLICDSASPEKIMELRRGGYNAKGAVKGRGSVFSGISLMQRANIYYTNTSINLESEYEEYEWRTDRVGVLDEPEKANDHCFVGETLISTPNGGVPISLIEPGNVVLTSKGAKRVLFRWNNGVKDIYEYTIKTNKGIIRVKCTENHKVKTNKGWLEISKLQKEMMVSLFSDTMDVNSSFKKEKGILTQDVRKCTGTFGRHLIKQRDQKDIISTTKMGTPTITDQITLSLKTEENTLKNTQKTDLKTIQNGLKNFIPKELKRQNHGTHLQRVLNGTNSKQRNITLEILTMEKRIANNVNQNLPRKTKTTHSAPITVNQSGEGKNELTMRQGNVNPAPNHLELINITRQNFVVPSVIKNIRVKKLKPQQVYDLTVEDEHEYFANGLLVHNCLDSTRYCCGYIAHKLRIVL